nr:hypothetical protein [Tanacetum cinerariifolium]
MSLTFADTHNMVVYLNKSDASEGFNQVIDFLNAKYIKYALTINPHIYVSCIKQFWNTVVVKQFNDVTRLQALVDKKKVVIMEATIRDALRLHDAEGVDCLPNEEIFDELARMGYEKPSTKLTFYKAFFSSQWKFLIHIILQIMNAKRTSWNEFSSAMASAVICLSTGKRFNFSKYIFESLVRNVDSSSKFYMYPRFIQLIIQNQLVNLSTHTTKYTSPALTQKVFANMRMVGKGFLGVETPLFEGMLVGVIEEQGDAEKQVQDAVDDAAAQGVDTSIQGDDVYEPTIPSPTPSTPPPQQSQALPSTSQVQHTPPQSPLPQSQPPPQAQPHVADFRMMAQDLEITKIKRRVKKLERGNKVKVLKVRRLKKVGTSQIINSSDDTVMEDASNQGRMIDALDSDAGVALMDNIEAEKKAEEAKLLEDKPAEVQEVVDVVTTAKLITEVISAASESVIAASITIAAAEPQVPTATITDVPVRVVAASTRRRKGVVIRDPEEESSIIIHADTKLNYFKGMSYNDIRPIFEAKFNSNIEFLLKSKEQLKEEENRAMQSINETPAQKAAKEDLDSLWSIVKEIFSTSNPNNFSDDFLLTTLGAMFERPDGQAQVWKNQRTVHGQAKLILLVQRRYLLLKFTLDQMLNAVKLRVEEQSEISLELLSFGVDAAMDLEEKYQVFNAAGEELNMSADVARSHGGDGGGEDNPLHTKYPMVAWVALLTKFDLRQHIESLDWTEINAGIQQHLQKAYNTNKAACKAQHWVIDPTTGTYNVEKIRRERPENITASEWDKYIEFWNDPRNIARAAQNLQNRAKSMIISRQGSRSLARLRDEM